MNTRPLLIALLAVVSAAHAAPPAEIHVEKLEPKIRLGLGQEKRVAFVADNTRPARPQKTSAAPGPTGTVEMSLKTTDCTPVVVRGNPTRPYLTVSNHLTRPLRYRAAARLKGSRKFTELPESPITVDADDTAQICWESGSLVEEVVLFQFSHPTPRK